MPSRPCRPVAAEGRGFDPHRSGVVGDTVPTQDFKRALPAQIIGGAACSPNRLSLPVPSLVEALVRISSAPDRGPSAKAGVPGGASERSARPSRAGAGDRPGAVGDSLRTELDPLGARRVIAARHRSRSPSDRPRVCCGPPRRKPSVIDFSTAHFTAQQIWPLRR
jgi:hypothetical protein